MRHATIPALMLAAALSAALPAMAPAGPIDRALAAAQPCEALPGFSTTDDLDLSRVDLTLRRDLVSLRAEGTIACTATGPGPMRGNLTGRVILRAVLDSETCELDEIDIDIGTLGGTLAPVVTPGLPEITQVLTSALSLSLTRGCRSVLDPYLAR